MKFVKGGRGNSAHTSVFPNGKLLYSDSEEYFHQSIAAILKLNPSTIRACN